VSQLDDEGNRAPEQIAVAPDLRVPSWLVGSEPQRPHDAVVEAGEDLDVVRTGLASDVRAPGFDVVDLIEAVDRLAVCEQLAIVVAAVDTRDRGGRCVVGCRRDRA